MMQSSYYVQQNVPSVRDRLKRFPVQSSPITPTSQLLPTISMIHESFLPLTPAYQQATVQPTFVHQQSDMFDHSPQPLAFFNPQFESHSSEQLLAGFMTQGFSSSNVMAWAAPAQQCQPFDAASFSLPQSGFQDSHGMHAQDIMLDCDHYSTLHFSASSLDMAAHESIEEDDYDSDSSPAASGMANDYAVYADTYSRSVSPLSSPTMPSTPGRRGRHTAKSSISLSSPPRTPRKPTKGTKTPNSSGGHSSHSSIGSMGFVNFTPSDSRRILTGVAPSGSSKTKARREREASERRRKLSEAAEKAVREAGGDIESLRRDGVIL